MSLQQVRVLSPSELTQAEPLTTHVSPLESPENVARTARVTASSSAGVCPPSGATNGVIGGLGKSDKMADEWVATSEKQPSWLRLSWDSPQTVNRICLFDRPNLESQVLEVEVKFSDGSTVLGGELPDNARKGRQIEFPAKTITWLEVRATKTRTPKPFGLSEILVFRAK